MCKFHIYFISTSYRFYFLAVKTHLLGKYLNLLDCIVLMLNYINRGKGLDSCEQRSLPLDEVNIMRKHVAGITGKEVN